MNINQTTQNPLQSSTNGKPPLFQNIRQSTAEFDFDWDILEQFQQIDNAAHDKHSNKSSSRSNISYVAPKQLHISSKIGSFSIRESDDDFMCFM